MTKGITRRQALQSIAVGGLAACARRSGEAERASSRALVADPRFLIVIGATGGASIIDSFLPIRQSETTHFDTINAFPDAQVENIAGSPIRAVNLTGSGLSTAGAQANGNLAPFATAHKNDMMVVTVETTSVNHVIGQRRSLSGNGAWRGRTLQECVALQYGQGRPLPNANMGAFGYLEPGSDDSLPAYCYGEPIANPLYWSLGLDGRRGIRNAPSAGAMARMRELRDEKLDPESVFYRTFKSSPRIQRWMAQRRSGQQELETLDLITKLTAMPNSPPAIPLAEYGLAQSPDGQRVLNAFPKLLSDPLEAQAALAFLLIKYGVSVSVTLSSTFAPVVEPTSGGGYNLLSLPLAFDNSHDKHRATQGIMWARSLSIADRLITLLKQDELSQGVSYWDRTALYIATDFGRSKERQGGSENFGSGHDLNNGALIVSPMASGNKVLGGVDPETALTYGFNLSTGVPDPARKTSEAELYSGLLGILGVDTTGAGLPDVPAMRKIA